MPYKFVACLSLWAEWLKNSELFLFASVLPLSVSWPICFGSTSRFSKYLNASYSSTESSHEGKGKEKKYKKDKGCSSPQLTYLILFLLQWHLESKVAPDHIWQRTTAALMPMGLNLVVCLATPCDGTACLLNHLSKGKTDWDVTRVSPTLNICIYREHCGKSFFSFFFLPIIIQYGFARQSIYWQHFHLIFSAFDVHLCCVCATLLLHVVESVFVVSLCMPPPKVCVCGRRDGAPGVVYDKRIDVNVYRSHSHAMLLCACESKQTTSLEF